MSTPFRIFVSSGRGLEPLVAAEVADLGAAAVRERNGGVEAEVDFASACRMCLWSRVGSRVLLPLETAQVADPDALYALARGIDWPQWFAPQRTFAIEVAGQSRALSHSRFAALKVKDAIADCFRDRFGARPDVSVDAPDVRVHLHLHDTAVTLSLDLSGESLHRRGYRRAGAAAPLKENLAAALLLRAGWPAIARAGGALIDPLCGSGTLVIEAALMAGDIAPNLQRLRFGFHALSLFDGAIWKTVHDEALDRAAVGRKAIPPLFGSDLDPQALAAATQNAHRAAVAHAIEWTQADATATRPRGTAPGLLIANPPYGERLGAEADLIKLYSLLGATLKTHFAGWHAAIFTARADLAPRLGLRAEKLYSLYNGDLPCKLLCFALAPSVVSEGESAPEVAPKLAEDLVNRLRKNQRHLARWAKRTGVASYRVYDADLPDYAVAVDLYQSEVLHLVVQEYAAPKTIDPVHAERRLREALAAIQAVFEVPSDRLHFRIRRAQKGAEQYSRRQNEDSHQHLIEEHGCKLWVNFEDYLDTGVFLDHRPMRRRIQTESRGRRVLNLFCYTGSVTAHAAVGGATATCSVDLSANYLEWARRNLESNGFAATVEAAQGASQTAWRGPRTQLAHGRGHSHRLVRADCLAWLREQAAKAAPVRYDLIFCDPPTFSNSKRMDETLDVQRDHVELIRHCMVLLAPGGTLYFSNNRKRFKLDQEALTAFEVRDITAQTLDEDFKRPPPPHRCWSIRVAETVEDRG